MAGSTREWVDFFQQAGIPSDEAASYALIFARNRIQNNMLIDLNKEYLKDMGITLLGDVIAILKHAKHVHESNSRASIMSLPDPIVVEEKSSTKTPAGGNTSKSPRSKMHTDAVKRLLDHYTRKYKEAEEGLSGTPKLPMKYEPNPLNSEKYSKPSTPKMSLKKEPVSSMSPMSKKSSNPAPDTLMSSFGKKSSNPEKNVVRLKEAPATQKLEVPLQKKWKVLPEHEGGYKITMPKKSARLSQTVKLEKTTVFARLGDGAVSSTTPDVASPKKASQSIFARLGDVSSTSPAEESSRKRKGLPYAGVLKKSNPPVSSLSMRADEEIKTKGRTAKKDLQMARDLKMLKITTEFSDDDDIEAVSTPASTVKVMPHSTHKSTKKRYADEAELEEEDLPSQPLPKRVRFGGTSTRVLPADPHIRVAAATVFTNHTIALKNSGPTRTKELTPMKKKLETSVKARIGVVKPRRAQPISKMVSDTMAADSLKHSVKNRIDFKGKGSKTSILDRLG